MKSAGEIFLSGLRGAKNCSNAFRSDRFSDPFSLFSNRFSWAAANGGVTNGGLRGVWPPLLEIGRNRPFSPFFCLFRPFPEGAKSTWETQKTEEKGLFPQISSELLKPPSLEPPFAALQFSHRLKSFSGAVSFCRHAALTEYRHPSIRKKLLRISHPGLGPKNGPLILSVFFKKRLLQKSDRNFPNKFEGELCGGSWGGFFLWKKQEDRIPPTIHNEIQIKTWEFRVGQNPYCKDLGLSFFTFSLSMGAWGIFNFAYFAFDCSRLSPGLKGFCALYE